MPRSQTACSAAALLLLLTSPAATAQQQVDPAIAKEIAAISAVDNHAHPVLAPPLDKTDRNFDALPVDNMEPQTDPLAYRPDLPALSAAWKALFDFNEAPPLDTAALKRLDAARDRRKQGQGSNYPQWILDQSNIATMLANRVSMGPGIQPPRFRWVPYVDALLFPFSNTALASASPDRKQFFALEDKLRAQYLKDLGLAAPPPTLDEYLKRVVTPTLERQRAGGAVAEKFELAYLRSFDISAPTHAQADSLTDEISPAATHPQPTTNSSRTSSSATSLGSAAAWVWPSTSTPWPVPAPSSRSPEPTPSS